MNNTWEANWLSSEVCSMRLGGLNARRFKCESTPSERLTQPLFS